MGEVTEKPKYMLCKNVLIRVGGISKQVDKLTG